MNRREALRWLGSGAAALALAGRQGAAEKNQGKRVSNERIQRAIPATGEKLPAIGLGTWQTFDVGAGAALRAPLEEVLVEFAALGGRVIDSSPMYGQSEAVAGDLAAKLELHEKLFLATKVWTSGREAGIAQMEESMRRLRTEKMDLLQVHNLVDAHTHLETLRGWKRDGRVRYIGVTHYTSGGQEAIARLLTKEAVDFIQINFSAGEREAEERVLPLARDKGVAVIVNRPFGGGGLLGRLRGQRLPAWAGEIGCESWAQVLLKYIVAHPAVTCAIPATSKVEHLRDNMAAGVGELPDEALRERIVREVG